MPTVLLSGCSGHDYDEPAASDSQIVNFTVSIYAGDPEAAGSRAGALPGDDYFDESLIQYERMRTLRVIIVRPSGVVEHNLLLQNTIPDTGLGQYSYARFKVMGSETKKVYLFANEASFALCGLNIDFNSYTAGVQFPAEEFAAYQLNCTPGQPLIDNTGTDPHFLPMSEVFDIDIRSPKIDGTDLNQSADLFVTRATVKFSFNIKALDAPTSPYTITELAIESLAKSEYLLPKATVYEPAKYPSSFEDRYITSYAVPAGEEGGELCVFRPSNWTFDADYTPGTVFTYAPMLYFAETALASEQTYKLKLKLNGDTDYTSEIALPNLSSLPRNTHVKVNISLENSDVKCSVNVLPYTSVILNPEFGFDELLPRPPVDPGDMPDWIQIPEPSR